MTSPLGFPGGCCYDCLSWCPPPALLMDSVEALSRPGKGGRWGQPRFPVLCGECTGSSFSPPLSGTGQCCSWGPGRSRQRTPLSRRGRQEGRPLVGETWTWAWMKGEWHRFLRLQAWHCPSCLPEAAAASGYPGALFHSTPENAVPSSERSPQPEPGQKRRVAGFLFSVCGLSVLFSPLPVEQTRIFEKRGQERCRGCAGLLFSSSHSF